MTEDPKNKETTTGLLLHDGSTLDLSGLDARQAWALLARCDLDNANFQGCHYAGLDLSGLHLQRSTLNACDFTGALFSGARFSYGHAQEANFTDGVWQQSSATAWNAKHANFTRVDLRGSLWDSVDVLGAVFDQAKLDEASFAKVIFSGASLKEICARDTSFVGSQFEYACLDGADLRSANLSGATFARASLRGADLSHATLNATSFAHADLSHACLEGLVFSGYDRCDFTGLKLKGATGVDADIHIRGTFREVDVLARRAPDMDGSNKGLLLRAAGKLWLDNSLSGEDYLTQPVDDLLDAIRALMAAWREDDAD